MIASILNFIILSASAAVSTPSDLSPVVLVQSELCAGPEQSWRGSGLIFEMSHETYILTSEHAVLHGNVYRGNNPICHSAITATGVRLPLVLVRADFAEGLALLQVKRGVQSVQVAPIESLHSRVVGIDEEVNVVGFPTSAGQSDRRAKGVVLNIKSERHLFLNPQPLIELAGMYGERGMSGGAVFSRQGDWLGVLTNQVLSVAEGATGVVQLEPTGSRLALNVLLAIPAPAAVRWIANTLSRLPGTKVNWDFTRDLGSQLQGVEVVKMGPLLFEWSDHPPMGGIGGSTGSGIGGSTGSGIGGSTGSGIGGSTGSGIGGSTGSGIGGSTGSGIGGSTGSGIGGSTGSGIGGVDQDPKKLGAIKISWNPGVTLEVTDLPTDLPRRDWFAQVAERVLREREPLWVSALYLRDPSASLRRLPIESLEGFFGHFRDKRTRVALIDPAHRNRLSKDIEEAKTLTEMTDKMIKAANPSTLQLLKKIRLVSLIAQSDDCLALERSDFDEIAATGPLAAQWDELFRKDFDLTVILLRAVDAVRVNHRG